MNTSNPTTTPALPASAADWAAIKIEAYPASLVSSFPTNEEFFVMARGFLPELRLAAMTLTKGKAELIELFRANPDESMELHEALTARRDYFKALSELCDTASDRILIAGSAVMGEDGQ